MEHTTIVPDSLHTMERLVGFNIWEDSSAAAVVELRAGSATGQIIRRIHLAADESAVIALPKAVFWTFPGGVYVKEDTGSIAGVLDHIN